MSIGNNLFKGLVSGLFAGLILIFAFWGIWLLPALGLILTKVTLTNGSIVAALFGIIGGLIYSLFVRERHLSISGRVLAGSLLGFVFWVGGVLTLVPVMLGFPPSLKSPQDHFFTLAVFVVYGISLAFIYQAFTKEKSMRSLGYGVGLIALSLIAAPFLLRGAVSTNPDDLDLPGGYKAEVIAKGLTYPTSLTMDEQGTIYVAESGHSYGPKTTEAKILRVDAGGKLFLPEKFIQKLPGLRVHEQTSIMAIKEKGKAPSQ